MKVKICGITDAETGKAAAEFGADAIGLVFSESKRKVSVERAKEIVQSLPEKLFKVGVFVNETKEEIERIASIVGLTHIQLHGDEDVNFCRSLSLPAIKAVGMENDVRLKELIDFPCEYLLVDGPKGKYRGGNGISFNWSSFHPELFTGKKVILAGGLNEQNVASAIKTINPYMVDVSSGVETDGKKDLMKIRRFIRKAKEA